MAKHVYQPAKCLHTTTLSLPFTFPQFFFPKPSWSLSFAVFSSSSSKSCTIPKSSPITCPGLLEGGGLSPKDALMLTHHDGFHVWTMGWGLSWSSLGKVLDSLSFPLISLIWDPACHYPLGLWWWTSDGFVAVVIILGEATTGYHLWLPTCLCTPLRGYKQNFIIQQLQLAVLLPSLPQSKVRDCACDFYLLFQCCTTIFYRSIPEQVVSQSVRDWPGFSLCFLRSVFL